MGCAYLTPDGRCKGLYRGFGCIRDGCRADREEPCAHNERGFYCRKFRKFECIGPGNCGSFNDYMDFVAKRERRAHLMK